MTAVPKRTGESPSPTPKDHKLRELPKAKDTSEMHQELGDLGKNGSTVVFSCFCNGQSTFPSLYFYLFFLVSLHLMHLPAGIMNTESSTYWPPEKKEKDKFELLLLCKSKNKKGFSKGQPRSKNQKHRSRRPTNVHANQANESPSRNYCQKLGLWI